MALTGGSNPFRPHGSGWHHGDGFILEAQRKGTCGAPELSWGGGAQLISPRWFWAGGGYHPGAPAVPFLRGVTAKHPLGTVGRDFPWAEPGRGTSPTVPSAEGCSGFGGSPLLLGGSLPLPAWAGWKVPTLLGRCGRTRSGLRPGRASGAPVPLAGPSSRSHGDTHHSTSSESYLRSWRISLIASMVLISLRERMETINKAHMERIIGAASPSPRCL